jgi:hypothetical protein
MKMCVGADFDHLKSAYAHIKLHSFGHFDTEQSHCFSNDLC